MYACLDLVRTLLAALLLIVGILIPLILFGLDVIRRRIRQRILTLPDRKELS